MHRHQLRLQESRNAECFQSKSTQAAAFSTTKNAGKLLCVWWTDIQVPAEDQTLKSASPFSSEMHSKFNSNNLVL